ncbi:MAG: hypothetical protein PHQ43_11970 [Dehalococcoidales bacterium]|nr:hypothetical protein [Dehalococcoidales bacterium]
MKKLKIRKIKLNFFDIALISGCMLICAGIWLIYVPAAVIAAGMFLIAGAVLLYKPKK